MIIFIIKYYLLNSHFIFNFLYLAKEKIVNIKFLNYFQVAKLTLLHMIIYVLAAYSSAPFATLLEL